MTGVQTCALPIYKYTAQMQSRGLVLSGKCVGRELVEIVELPDHPWFLAVQFHPELKSLPHEPHPLFRDFVRASLERRRARLGDDGYDPAAEDVGPSGAEREDESDRSERGSETGRAHRAGRA